MACILLFKNVLSYSVLRHTVLNFDICVTVHHQYNDVNNQQDETNFCFLIFLIQPYMFRATNSPILRSTF